MDAPKQGRTAPGMQTRLVQQMARIRKAEDEVKADLKGHGERALHVVQQCNMWIERMAPALEKWIAADFQPDTPRMRKLAGLYIKIIQRRQDALFAGGIAEKHLTEAT